MQKRYSISALGSTRRQVPGLRLSKRNIVYMAVLLLALYVITPQLGKFNGSFNAIQSAHLGYVVAAGVFIGFAVVASAVAYYFLALRPIRFREMVLVQTAGMFVNRLLPAGIGGLGLSVAYLHAHKHTLAKATAVAGLNNVLTSFGHGLLLIIVSSLVGAAWPDFNVTHLHGAAAAGIVLGLAVLLSMYVLYRNTIRLFMANVLAALRLYRSRPRRVLQALVGTMCNTGCHALAIYLCMFGYGVELNYFIALVVLTGGVAVASATPTPGGLGGSEAGMTAVLVGYGVSANTALAIALTYRLVSYWLPLLPGALAFLFIDRRKLI